MDHSVILKSEVLPSLLLDYWCMQRGSDAACTSEESLRNSDRVNTAEALAKSADDKETRQPVRNTLSGARSCQEQTENIF